MRTYAEYLASLTVKALQSIAKQGGYKGYSKLRKAELVAFIDGESVIDWDGAEQVTILSVESPADLPRIAEIMAQTATPAESAPEATTDDTEDLVTAYVNMRSTIRSMRSTAVRVSIVAKLRILSATLRSRGVSPQYL